MRAFLLLLLCGTIQLSAQVGVGLVGYYPLDTSFVDLTGTTANTGDPQGGPTFVCGVDGNALALDGVDDQVVFIGPVNDEFDTEDFTVSFYFKSTGQDGIQYLLSKRSEDCAVENIFYIRYVPATNTINCFLSEDADNSLSLVQKLDDNLCWHHIALVRKGIKVLLYINGEFDQELGTTFRLDVMNSGDLILGGSNCKAQNETNFDGIIDDLRFYNRGLDKDEIRELYYSPDQIASRDTTIFLGNNVDILLTPTCATTFTWSSMEDELFSSTVDEPSITPPTAGEFFYDVAMADNLTSCVAMDQIRINVIDPDDLDCSIAFVPKAFTPNGDGLNDTYGISNPFAIQELLSFEIFDRWGGMMFSTNDPFSKWDGTFDGEEVNPGVLLYRINYICEGEEKLLSGSFTILR